MHVAGLPYLPDRLGHERNRVTTGIGDAAGENRDNRRRRRVERIDHRANLIERENRGHVEHDAFRRQCADELGCRLAHGVGDGNFDVHVGAPRRDRARLLGHAREIVREHLERDRPVRNSSQDFARKRFVIADAGLAHQRRIGGESLDRGVLRHFHDAFVVGTVGENLYLEIGDPAHGPSCAVRTVSMMRSAASAIERAT